MLWGRENLPHIFISKKNYCYFNIENFIAFINGERREKYLWAKSVEAQIEYMKEIWYSLPNEEKPEGMTFEDILEYEKRMK